VTHGANRDEAMARMRKALDNYVIRGVTHNISLMSDILNEDKFKSGVYTTKYLQETYPDGFSGSS